MEHGWRKVHTPGYGIRNSSCSKDRTRSESKTWLGKNPISMLLEQEQGPTPGNVRNKAARCSGLLMLLQQALGAEAHSLMAPI